MSKKATTAEIIKGRPPYMGKWLWKRKEDQPYWREVTVGPLSGGANYCHVHMGWDEEEGRPRYFEMEDGDSKRPWCGFWILLKPNGDEHLREVTE
jgi:hypothetical protein